jgi:hypothetical protein
MAACFASAFASLCWRFMFSTKRRCMSSPLGVGHPLRPLLLAPFFVGPSPAAVGERRTSSAAWRGGGAGEGVWFGWEKMAGLGTGVMLASK